MLNYILEGSQQGLHNSLETLAKKAHAKNLPAEKLLVLEKGKVRKPHRWELQDFRMFIRGLQEIF